MKLGEIHWPIFRLKDVEPEEEHGRLVYKNEYLVVDDGNMYKNTTTVDYLGCGKPTLAERRMAAIRVGDKMYNPKKAVFSIADLLKSPSKYYWIDSMGRVFKYAKSTWYDLTFHKVLEIIPSTTSGRALVLQGLDQRFFTSLTLDKHTNYWAGVLSRNNKFLLYGVYLKPYAPSRRKV